MGRKRNTTGNCKGTCMYCGRGLPNGGHICGNCSVRIKLIRTMQKMIRDTVEKGCRV